jgi:GTPase SAR1 family protein
MKASVRIAVVGEDGVGKTSLVTALLSEGFQEKVRA